jgi:hypothetical protein
MGPGNCIQVHVMNLPLMTVDAAINQFLQQQKLTKYEYFKKIIVGFSTISKAIISKNIHTQNNNTLLFSRIYWSFRKQSVERQMVLKCSKISDTYRYFKFRNAL